MDDQNIDMKQKYEYNKTLNLQVMLTLIVPRLLKTCEVKTLLCYEIYLEGTKTWILWKEAPFICLVLGSDVKENHFIKL